MRLPLDEEEKVDIQMSPLIDCVFLLLIFFLVTTMMKKWEMQIPLSLPEMTSSLSTTRSGENTVIIAVPLMLCAAAVRADGSVMLVGPLVARFGQAMIAYRRLGYLSERIAGKGGYGDIHRCGCIPFGAGQYRDRNI